MYPRAGCSRLGVGARSMPHPGLVGVAPPQFFGVEVGRTFDVAMPVGTATLIRGTGVLEQRSSWWLRIVLAATIAAGTVLIVQRGLAARTRPAGREPARAGGGTAGTEPAPSEPAPARQEPERMPELGLFR